MRKKSRTIRLEKARIKRLATTLAEDFKKVTTRTKGPLGRKILSKRYETITIRTVDGKPLVVHVRMESIPTRSPKFVVSGGKGKDSSGRTVVIIFVNGSIAAEDIGLIFLNNQWLIEEDIYNFLIHELTHAADVYTKGVGETMTMEEAQGNAAYYNHPSEFRAYLQEIIDQVERRFKHLDKLKRNLGPTKTVETLLNLSDTWQEVSPYLTRANQQKVFKTVAQVVDRWEAKHKMAMRIVRRWKER